MPPIDLSQLSPKRSKSARPGKTVSKSVSVSQAKISVQLQTGGKKNRRGEAGPQSKSVDIKNNRKQIAREIKLRVQKSHNGIAGEIKRRVELKERESLPGDSVPKSSAYVDLGEQLLTNRSYSSLNSFRGYDLYKEMSPRIEAGEVSCWQCLPEELWLHILLFLELQDLHSFMLTCSDFNRLAHDRSLWNQVSVTKKMLSDDEIVKLGHLHPTRLSIVQCTGVKMNGDTVSNRGLRELFSQCGKDLRHLSTVSCVMPPLSGEAMLHHAVVHCPNIHSLDLSWCNLTNRDVELVAENFVRLRLLCLNGNQAITDIGMSKVFTSLWNQLEQLEIQGCFKLTNTSLQRIGKCINLRNLNIGQCHKLSSSSIMNEVSQLPYLEMCGLKGLKQLKDNCIAEIVKSCSCIQHLVLSQCTALTPKSLIEVSCALPSLRILDVSSCKDCVNDASLCALLANCTKLISLDLSSTHVSNQSLSAISNSCFQLRELRLNFCSVTDVAVRELLAQAKCLEKLFLYGVKGTQVEGLADINPKVSVEN